jgi:putative NADH-flavin reductase
MKLVVFGATGGNGKYILDQALAAGHEVTAVARNPAKITLRHKNLHVVQGDVMDVASIKPALVGQDAVISTLGAPDRGPTRVYSEGMTNIMQAMQTSGVRRVLCISASGLEPANLIQKVVAKRLLWTFLKESYTDLVRMETIVKASSLDWTIVRPPRLSDGPATGVYHDAINKQLTDNWVISRADLADYLLRQINNRATYCAVVEVAH